MKRMLLCLMVGLMLVACGGGRQKSVPRNRTLIMECSSLSACSGQIKDYNSFNPFLLIGVTKTGWNFLYEPLYFYNAFKGEMIPWIATGHQFN